MTNSISEGPQQMLTIPQIANKLNRTRQGVMHALNANGIEPQAEAGRVKLYTAEVVPKLRLLMRKPNRKNISPSN